MSDDPYSARYRSADPYVYPGTQTLKNRRDIRDPGELADYEKKRVALRALSVPELDRPLTENYQALHRHLFQDVYQWAGEYRSVTLSKANVRFCHAAYIEREMNERFGKIAQDARLGPEAKDRAAFAAAAAEHIVELNSIHPFREGNGRTMRAFIGQLARRAGYRFDEQKLDRRAWLEASAIGHIKADYAPMEKVIDGALCRERTQHRQATRARGKDQGLGE